MKEIISELTKVENKFNYVNILTMNIQLGDKETISIIKLVQSIKQHGNLAIEKAELPSSLQIKDEKINQKIKESKTKAALLRESLVKDFQNNLVYHQNESLNHKSQTQNHQNNNNKKKK